jgi:hypothetical protein
VLTLRVRGGELEPEPWVYAWLAADGVVYVGATALHPATRTWLHLHADDPDVARMRARFATLVDEELDVLAVPLSVDTDRQQARHGAVRLLAERGLLSERSVCDPPPEAEPTAESVELADAVAARLR